MCFFFYTLLSKPKQKFTILHHWDNWWILKQTIIIRRDLWKNHLFYYHWWYYAVYYLIPIVAEIITNTSNSIAPHSVSKFKTATKKLSYYTSSNKLLWTIHLSGTFSYNGSSSSCTKASCSISNLNSNWSVKSKSVTSSKNIARAKITMHQKGGGNLSKELTLACDKNGKLK